MKKGGLIMGSSNTLKVAILDAGHDDVANIASIFPLIAMSHYIPRRYIRLKDSFISLRTTTFCCQNPLNSGKGIDRVGDMGYSGVWKPIATQPGDAAVPLHATEKGMGYLDEQDLHQGRGLHWLSSV